jgi:hypothetical protein
MENPIRLIKGYRAFYELLPTRDNESREAKHDSYKICFSNRNSLVELNEYSMPADRRHSVG